jgi:hypothetical protein
MFVLAKRTKENHCRSQEVYSVFPGTFQNNAGKLIAQPRSSAILSPDFFFWGGEVNLLVEPRNRLEFLRYSGTRLFSTF